MSSSNLSRPAGIFAGLILGMMSWGTPIGANAQPPAATNSVTGQVGAPPRTFDMQTRDFDSWCLMAQSYPRERCDARRREDLDAFDNFRLTVERYEVEFMQKRERDRAALERMNRDPTSTERNLQVAPIR